jgi:hypothetical protein
MEKLVVTKRNGVLTYKDIEGYETRNISTFRCIVEADKIYQWNDFEITIHTGDGDKCKEGYSYSKDTMDNLVPDFNFDSWPQVGINDYITTIREIEDVGKTPAELLKIGWIGNIDTNIMRKKLWGYGKANSNLLDIIDMKWSPSSSIQLNATTFLTLPELVKKYSFLIDIEGYGYSGRLKYLLWSNRPVFLVDRPWKEFFFEHLREWEHYIPVKRDLSDLLPKIIWCFKNHKKAKEIAANALEFSKTHLTREACYSRWNDIIEKL